MLNKITKNDPIIDKLIYGDNSIIYSVIDKIRFNYKDPMLYTDYETCIIAWSDENHPTWLFLNKSPGLSLQNELIHFFKGRLLSNPNLSIICDYEKAAVILKNIKDFKTTLMLNSYKLNDINLFTSEGVIKELTGYSDDLFNLKLQFLKDIGDTSYDVDLIRQNLNEYHGYGLYVDGELVSIAGISGTECIYSITGVVTKEFYKCHGYAKHLVSYLADKYNKNDIIVMLNADANNPIANKVYKEIGFKCIYTLCKIKFL